MLGFGKKKTDVENLELRFWALMSVPDKQLELIGKFEEQASPKKTRPFSKAFYMSHEGLNGSEGAKKSWARKALFRRWKINIHEDGGDEAKAKAKKSNTKTFKFGRWADADVAVKEAAGRLAESVIDLKQRFNRVKIFNLREAEALEYEFGSKKLLFHNGKEGEISKDKDIGHDQMLVEAFITMPPSFHQLFKEMRDTVAIEGKLGSMGSFVMGVENDGEEGPGVIFVENLGNKDWQVTDLGQSGDRKNLKGYSPKEVIDKIAFDLAVANYDEEDIFSHIKNYPIDERRVANITTAYSSYGQKEFKAEGLEQG